jgi:hypothetical protein
MATRPGRPARKLAKWGMLLLQRMLSSTLIAMVDRGILMQHDAPADGPAAVFPMVTQVSVRVNSQIALNNFLWPEIILDGEQLLATSIGNTPKAQPRK